MYSDTDLTNGQQYCYKISSLYVDCESLFSNTLCAIPSGCDSGTDCDDGLYCNGQETCDNVTGECQAGTNPCSDDGQFCNGAEDCDEIIDQCFSSGNPCPSPLICDEDLDACAAVGDSDGDGIPDGEDNCPVNHNPNQEDVYPPQGNGIGDACDCEGDFDCNGNVDAGDVTIFLSDFGRGQYYQPCTATNPCNGDFDCDGDVDASEINTFLEDFGRGQYFDPCPACEVGAWCIYP